MIDTNKGDIDSPIKKYHAGRTKISDSRRTRSFSQRTSLGKMNVKHKDEGYVCPSCGHRKAFQCESSSAYFGKIRCTRCKKEYKK